MLIKVPLYPSPSQGLVPEQTHEGQETTPLVQPVSRAQGHRNVHLATSLTVHLEDPS